jgi:M6 family metalloprotease-like protein
MGASTSSGQSAGQAPTTVQAHREEGIVGRPPPPVRGRGRTGALPCGLEGTLNDGYRYRRASGTLRAAMIFVDFSDVPADGSLTPAQLYENFVPRSAEAFRRLSSGRFELSVTPATVWARMPEPNSSYGFGDDNGSTYEDFYAYIRDAVAAADPYFDFSGYSAVFVVPAPGSKAPFASGPGEANGEGFMADGHEVTYSAALRANDEYDLDFTGLVHETGHMLGLPDLYDTENQGSFVGVWDVMDQTGSADTPMTAWSRLLVGWLGKSDFRCVTRSATKTLTPVDRPGGLKAMLVKTSSTSAYVVEARSESDRDGCRRDGVLVYRVRTTRASGEGPVRVLDAADPPDGCYEHGNATFIPGDDSESVYRAGGGKFTLRVAGQKGDGFRVLVKTKR